MNELAHMENISAEETTEASEVAFRAATLKVIISLWCSVDTVYCMYS